MRLIDADKIEPHEQLESLGNGQYEYVRVAYMDDIDVLPTVDAVPVVHGRWKTDGIMMDECEFLMTRCTACGEAYEYGFNMPFCPNCGARMDGDDD